MLHISVKRNGASSPREWSASAVRKVIRASSPERATSPERPKHRTFAAEHKLRIVREADAALASRGESAVPGHAMERTTPPSTRTDAPVVPLASVLDR